MTFIHYFESYSKLLEHTLNHFKSNDLAINATAYLKDIKFWLIDL